MSARLAVDVVVPLHGFDLKAAFETDAATIGLFGNSGAGKTTLLETIAGLRRNASGRVVVGGETWLDSERKVARPPEQRGVGYVPQDGLLFPHWNVTENIVAGAHRRGRDGAPRIDTDHVIEVLDLGAVIDRRVESLSGGERQRVALARALCSGPSLLLLDEPLASIEAALRGRILHYLLAVRDEFRIPTVYVSHEATEVTILCDVVVVIHRGAPVAKGRPEEVFTAAPPHPCLPGAAYENVLEGTIESVEGGRATVSLGAGRALVLASSEGAAAGARVLAGIRAQDLMIAVSDTPGLSARTILPGTIRDLRDVDGGAFVMVDVGAGQPLVAVMVTDAARRALSLAPGIGVRLVAKAQSCRLLAVR